jgi:hypothetical protein
MFLFIFEMIQLLKCSLETQWTGFDSFSAYGTYKLGKSMAKGLRDLYDDDDCWQYNILQDRYNCVCQQQVHSALGFFRIFEL